MKVFYLFALLIGVCCVENVQSSRILCFFPSTSRSHLLVAQALLKELATRGHDVTMVSTFPLSKPVKNYRDIYVPLLHLTGPMMKNFMKEQTWLDKLKLMPQMSSLFLETSNITLHSPQFRKIMEEETFDLFVAGFFVTDFILGLGAHFKCPTIMVCSIGATKFINDLTGNPAPIAAVPNLMLGYINPMNFKARVLNLIFAGLDMMATAFLDYRQQIYYDSNFPSDKYPSYYDVKKNVSLVLLNQHFTHGIPRPYIQNTIEVGGLQIKSKPSPLPEDIQEWLDGAEHGVIFFSFGSNLKGSDISQEKLEALLQTFSKLKQRVLWKWDMDELPNKPDNVMIGKWLPQDDILAHKNIQLFITHGGLGSVAEAKYHGVPIIGVPMFGDQPLNVENTVKEGWGIAIEYTDLNEETLTKAIHEIFNNPSYKFVVKEMSSLFRDRPLSAMDTAIFWVEYVIRHKGAHHMRYQGVDLNFFQANSIDVILFLLALGGIAYFILKVIVKRLWKLLTQRKMKEKIN